MGEDGREGEEDVTGEGGAERERGDRAGALCGLAAGAKAVGSSESGRG